MVEGPNDVHAVEEVNGFAGIEDCTIKDGVAVCTFEGEGVYVVFVREVAYSTTLVAS